MCVIIIPIFQLKKPASPGSLRLVPLTLQVGSLWWGVPRLGRMPSSTPGLLLPDAESTFSPICVNQNVCRFGHMSPGGGGGGSKIYQDREPLRQPRLVEET